MTRQRAWVHAGRRRQARRPSTRLVRHNLPELLAHCWVTIQPKATPGTLHRHNVDLRSHRGCHRHLGRGLQHPQYCRSHCHPRQCERRLQSPTCHDRLPRCCLQQCPRCCHTEELLPLLCSRLPLQAPACLSMATAARLLHSQAATTAARARSLTTTSRTMSLHSHRSVQTNGCGQFKTRAARSTKDTAPHAPLCRRMPRAPPQQTLLQSTSRRRIQRMWQLHSQSNREGSWPRLCRRRTHQWSLRVRSPHKRA